MRRGLSLAAALALLSASGPSRAYEVRYEAQILPDRGIAKLSIEIEQAAGEVLGVSFAIDPGRFFDETGDGNVRREVSELDETRLVWEPPASGGSLRYKLRVDHVREGSEYDARCASTWLVSRAEDLFPPMAGRFDSDRKTEGSASIRFRLPPRWKVAHPFAVRNGVTVIEQEHRTLEQPKGWIVAGQIERISAQIGETRVILASPEHHRARLRDMLAFLRWTLPELEKAFGGLPERLFVASSGNPMWRGGLSAPGSVYLHTDRPFIDDDASSPLLHELVHTITRARSAPGEDWIVEGVAERYSREILRRSGAVDDAFFERTLETLRQRGRRVDELVGEATGAETALAVAFFEDLDADIRKASDGAHSLDDFVATLVDDLEPIDRATLALRVRETTGFDPEALIRTRIPPAPEALALQ